MPGICCSTMLENGIRVVTESMPEVRSIAIGILIDAGPQDERPEQAGIAHLVEHVMFQGTSSRDATQIAHLMDIAGGQLGAFTARDYTCYYATVLDEYRTYALDLLGDILLNSIFPPESLEREKDAILHEMSAAQDAPGERVNNLLKTSAWPGHPLGRPVAGFPETVKRLTREDVIYFVHERYLPDRIIIAAAGNVEHEDFVAQVRDAFWRMLGQAPERVQVQLQYAGGVVIEPAALSQVYFSLGFRALPYAHPNRYSMHVLNNILGGGISSRLFRLLREERGLVYQIGSEYHAYRQDGLFVIEGSTSPQLLMHVLGLTLVETWKLLAADQPPDEEELLKAKMQIRSQHLLASENTNTRMSRLATQALYFGEHISAQEILEQIEAVDALALQRLAEQNLLQALGQPTLAILGPQSPDHYNQDMVQDLLAQFQ